MSRANETDNESEQPPRPTRAQRLVAAGFLGAFGLTIITVLLTGLKVGVPAGPRHAPEPPPAVAAPSRKAFAPSSAAAQRAAKARAAEPATGAAGPGNGDEEAENSARAKEAGEPPPSPAR